MVIRVLNAAGLRQSLKDASGLESLGLNASDSPHQLLINALWNHLLKRTASIPSKVLHIDLLDTNMGILLVECRP